MKTVALLPMKLHSARVKGKNFRFFAGKPLFQWILDTLLSIDEIDQVVINTDARGKLMTAGLESSDRVLIRDRKKDLCGDFVSMNAVLADDVENVEAETYIMTHTTNPLLQGTTILEALAAYHEKLQEGTADSLFSVNAHQTRFYHGDGTPINHDPNNLLRTQDLEPWYEENSNLYIFSAESFWSTNARIGLRPTLFETPRLQSVDIDDTDTWNIAEAFVQHNRQAYRIPKSESANGAPDPSIPMFID